jgi:hypothetical protein
LAQDREPVLINLRPFHRICEGWPIKDELLKQLLAEFDYDSSYKNFEDNYSIEFADTELHQRAFLHVITETIFDYPHNANGEKTMKSIASFRPFVIVGVPNSLRDLKNLGFKTFSSWWSEDYDQIEDPTERIYAVYDIIKWICSIEPDQLKAMLVEMQPVLEHNYNYYYDCFLNDQLAKFDLACQENLKPR